MTPVCGEACHKKAFDSIRENWQENMRAWLEGKLDEGPVRAPDTKMKDVRFTFMFPTGHQMNLIHTHPLPARLCANTDDKNDKAVQRAMQDELRQVTC